MLKPPSYPIDEQEPKLQTSGFQSNAILLTIPCGKLPVILNFRDSTLACPNSHSQSKTLSLQILLFLHQVPYDDFKKKSPGEHGTEKRTLILGLSRPSLNSNLILIPSLDSCIPFSNIQISPSKYQKISQLSIKLHIDTNILKLRCILNENTVDS